MISSIYAKEVTARAWFIRRKTDRYSWAWNPKANKPSKVKRVVLKNAAVTK